MRAPRVLLLLAAGLLVAAELISVSLLLRGISEHRAEISARALADAAPLVPRIVEWIQTSSPAAGETLSAPWMKPFDEASIHEAASLALGEEERGRLEAGELIVLSPFSGRDTSVVGSVRIDERPVLFRLTEASIDANRLATDGTRIAQHFLILLCALTAFMLAALSRARPQAEASPQTLRAYEEAMLRLRVRDDERLAAFDQERLQLTSVLRDREAMARAGELTAGIVHEVRNSLGVIAARARVAEQSGDARVRTASAAIVEEVRTLQSVMTCFVDFIRTEKVEDIEFDLKSMVNRVAARERSKHRARIEVAGAETRIRGDEALLETAIENVIRNACQASDDAGTVVVSFGADRTHAFVIVEDAGPGGFDVGKALRPFESSRPGGLGLGLPLVLKILTLHRGTLDLGPRRNGKGTQAVCRWPLAGPNATSGNEDASGLEVRSQV